MEEPSCSVDGHLAQFGKLGSIAMHRAKTAFTQISSVEGFPELSLRLGQRFLFDGHVASRNEGGHSSWRTSALTRPGEGWAPSGMLA